MEDKSQLNGKIRRFFILLTCTAIAATLYFIFGNSMASKKESQEQSETVYESVEPALDTVFGEDEITIDAFRKFAHFGEFMLLGAEIAVLLILLKKFNIFYALGSLGAGFLFGAADETVQIFWQRGASFVDVLIDFSGYFISTAIAYVLYRILSKYFKDKEWK